MKIKLLSILGINEIIQKLQTLPDDIILSDQSLWKFVKSSWEEPTDLATFSEGEIIFEKKLFFKFSERNLAKKFILWGKLVWLYVPSRVDVIIGPIIPGPEKIEHIPIIFMEAMPGGYDSYYAEIPNLEKTNTKTRKKTQMLLSYLIKSLA